MNCTILASVVSVMTVIKVSIRVMMCCLTNSRE